jgi:hypothetical protein
MKIRQIAKKIAALLKLTRTTAATKSPAPEILSGSWLFIDRPDKAKDNAEVLFRYAVKNTSRSCFFVVRSSSSDWARLRDEGFGSLLIDYGSQKHKKAMQECALLISSQADYTIAQPPFKSGKVDVSKIKFVFLQLSLIHI